MSLSTLKEIRDNIAGTTRETQIADRINEYINLAIDEIQSPSWAFTETGRKDFHHLWRANRRKGTLSTTSSQEDYQLARDVDEIGFFRQTTSPIKLVFVPDELFYKWIPNPTATGNPRFYRLWEEFGVSTQLTADDTIDVVSSSTSDNQTVIVRGNDADGLDVTESFTLNGTTIQTGSTTFSEILQVSKSDDTAGTITVTENSGSTTIVLLSPEERSPRFKRVSFYPIPSSSITVSYEYYTQFRHLVNDTDVPDFDSKWHWLVRTGALSKVYQYQNKELDFKLTRDTFASGVRAMVKSDIMNLDYIPYLKDTSLQRTGVGIVELADGVFSGWF